MSVIVVTFENSAMARRYAEKTAMPWPLLVDEKRKLYRAYEMEKGGWWDLWGWPSWKVYLQLLAKGRRLQRPTGDPQQLGGDVIVDPAGIVRFQWIASGPAARPRVSQLLDAVPPRPV